MKHFFPILMICILAAGCNNNTKALREQIEGSDSVAINYFKGDGKMDTVVAVSIIKDKAAIDSITALLTAGDASIKDNCGFDGSIHFFKNDRVIQDVYFNVQDNCRQVIFQLNKKNVAGTLSEQAGKFLLAKKNATF